MKDVAIRVLGTGMLLISVLRDYAVGTWVMESNCIGSLYKFRVDVFALDRVSADSPSRLNTLTRVTSFFNTQSPRLVGWDSDKDMVENTFDLYYRTTSPLL